MRILGFDTATAATCVALLDTEAGLELEARDDPPPGETPRHATRLLALIVEVLGRAATGWEQVDRIAVGVGPGTFTGLRIGVASARALGQARAIPLIGISTLESLSLNVRCTSGGSGHDVVLAVLDARRGEAFAGAWQLRSGSPGAQGPAALGERLLEPCAIAPAELAARVPGLGRTPLAIGPGAVEFRTELERSGATVPMDVSELHKVSALNHCQLAAGSGSTQLAGDISPEYLRLPDAELARRRRAAPTDPRAARPAHRE